MLREEFYDEVYEWVASLPKKEAGKGRTIVGLNAPQGAGKTTLGEALRQRFESAGIGFLALSIDDFYLTREDQLKLAKANPQVNYFQQRGYPGTHDIALGTQVLSDLHQGIEVRIPRYDKSRYQGQGDRKPRSEWTFCGDEVEFILVEGWMLGFQPTTVPLCLQPANLQLEKYSSWYQHLDAFFHLQIDDFQWVVEWRVEAEEKRKSQGEEGMSKADITKYAEMFIPAYEAFTPTLKNFQSNFNYCNTWIICKNRCPQ